MSGHHPAGNGMNNTMGSGAKKQRYTQMTFFWGKNSEILFTGWPGTSGGHYALGLILCFLLALLVEWISTTKLARRGMWWRVVVHGLKVLLFNLIMLAVMSFNVGVLLVTIAGHVVGLRLFGCSKQPDTTCCTDDDNKNKVEA